MKQEAKLKSAFMHELRRQLPTFITLQYTTAGAPDREIVGNGRTSMWEMKHGTPSFASLGNQELLCMRLAAAGIHCRYIIWQESRDGSHQRTLIVSPRDVHERQGWALKAEAACDGYDHRWLVEQVKKAHEV